ncbi:MAG TPA: phosphate/phosphite/phosphonate ABC transporter substrate-binding protein [Planctomycetota bacterium]|nr:phosphate/phosphite/phosphonate ABC transporter substrate-binding protein [Planctomycetota bacterium]
MRLGRRFVRGGALVAFVALVALLALPALLHRQEGEVDDDLAAPRVLSLGSVSGTPKEEVERFQPFADELARRLAGSGVAGIRIVVAASIDEMSDLLKRREVDAYFDSPFPVARACAASGAHVVLRQWKGGVPEYRSALFARADAGIVQIEDLRGRIVVFESPYSTSAYFLAKAALSEAGLDPFLCTDPAAPIPHGRVGYLFAGSEETAVFWALRGRVAAVAIDPEVVGKYARAEASKLRSFWRSPIVPRSVVAFRARLERRLAGSLEGALLGLTGDSEGKVALEKLDGTARFDRFPRGAEIDLAPILSMKNALEREDAGR